MDKVSLGGDLKAVKCMGVLYFPCIFCHTFNRIVKEGNGNKDYFFNIPTTALLSNTTSEVIPLFSITS